MANLSVAEYRSNKVRQEFRTVNYKFLQYSIEIKWVIR